MTIQIGRFGIDIAAGEMASWAESGATVSLSGVTAYANAVDAMALRRQLIGYVDSPDEDFVPVVWDEDPSVDGFYRVTSVSVDARAGRADQGLMDFSVDLERVKGFAAPLVESVALGALRTSSLGLTARKAIAIPVASRSYVEYTDGSFIPQSVDVVRVGETSSVNVFTTLSNSFIGQSYVPPGSFYDGAATLLVGPDERVAVGRQIGNTPDSWVLSNDLLQVRPAGSDLFELEFRGWNVSEWSEWQTLRFNWGATGGTHTALPAPHTITVLSNSPTGVTIRLLSTSNGAYSPTTIDLTLRRGSRSVAVEWRTVFTNFMSVTLENHGGADNITGGYKAAIDATALSFIGSASPLWWTLDTTAADSAWYRQGTVAAEAATSFPFCFGVNPASETSQNQLNEYFWAGSEKQTVVAR